MEKLSKENELLLERLNQIIQTYLQKKEETTKSFARVAAKEEKLILETSNTMKEELTALVATLVSCMDEVQKIKQQKIDFTFRAEDLTTFLEFSA